MRRIIKSIVAIFAVMSIPLIAAAPAQATSPDLSSFTFDCDTYSFYPFPMDVPLYSASVDVHFENCSGSITLSDPGVTGNASTGAGVIDDSATAAIGTMTVTGDTLIVMVDVDHDYAYLNFVTPFDMPDPDGVQLADSSQELTANAPAAVWGTKHQIASGNEIEIGGMNECGIIPGEHVYATQSFTVSTAGDYTFRITGTDPVSGILESPFSGYTGHALEDPMVALYSTFNTLDPSSDIVGCNDDLNDLSFGGHDYSDPAYNLSQQGDYIEGHFSYFSATLDPGDYMLVFTTWSENNQTDWATNSPDGATAYFDAWGPVGGLTLTDEDPIAVEPPKDHSNGGSGSTLAFTGVDPSFGLWTAAFLIGTGVTITIARRRRQSSN